MNGVGHAPTASLSVLLNVSYHKVHDYIWFRAGDLKGFRDSKAFMKLRGWTCLGTPPGDILLSVNECILS